MRICIFMLANICAFFNLAPGTSEIHGQEPVDSGKAQEYYQLQQYDISSADNQQQFLQYLEQIQIPALKALSVDRIGVFTVDNEQTEEEDFTVFVLTPYADLNSMADVQKHLLKQIHLMVGNNAALKPIYTSVQESPMKSPIHGRIETRVMRAFAEIPVLEQPSYSKNRQGRMFELRLYESHNEEYARRKIKMFNEGELNVMHDAKMGPIFFGETISGPDVPNLVYMLSAENMQAHKQHWQAFLQHPDWNRMKNMEEYKDTVSKIRNWFLLPTDFSDL